MSLKTTILYRRADMTYISDMCMIDVDQIKISSSLIWNNQKDKSRASRPGWMDGGPGSRGQTRSCGVRLPKMVIDEKWENEKSWMDVCLLCMEPRSLHRSDWSKAISNLLKSWMISLTQAYHWYFLSFFKHNLLMDYKNKCSLASSSVKFTARSNLHLALETRVEWGRVALDLRWHSTHTVPGTLQCTLRSIYLHHFERNEKHTSTPIVKNG